MQEKSGTVSAARAAEEKAACGAAETVGKTSETLKKTAETVGRTAETAVKTAETAVKTAETAAKTDSTENGKGSAPAAAERAAGVLLHISSLPGKYGIGTLGREARRFADFLHAAGVRYWQVLPLVQTGYGDSPYQSVFSASGNPYFIDPETLAAEGLLKKRELALCERAGERVDYGFLYDRKFALLRKAFSRFDCTAPAFRAFEEEGAFHDYALYMALKTAHGGQSFDRWERKYKFRDPAALDAFLRENRGEYSFWLFVQYEFLRQWQTLKEYVNALGIRIIGEIPLYVAADSADVWANAHLFKLNKNLSCRKVAGVPPDYFSATGQLWGNPVYDWKAHAQEGYAWWTARIRRAFALYDVVRVDHFRGFDRYYEIPAGNETAVGGRWRRGPGMALFDAAQRALGKLDFIAEDLGTIDDGVRRLIRKSGFPSMKVLEFAFDGDPNNAYLPKNIGENSVTYTGTHDNDTLVGYLKSLSAWEYGRLLSIVKPLLKEAGIAARPVGIESTARAIARLALSVRSRLAVLPMQDVLLQGAEARMNTPSTGGGNWQYRLPRIPGAACARALRAAVEEAGRAR